MLLKIIYSSHSYDIKLIIAGTLSLHNVKEKK